MSTNLRAVLGVVGLGVLLAAPVRAQSDEQAVIAVVNHFFDGMRTRDTALMRSTAVPSAVVIRASGPTGLTEPSTLEGFIERVGKGTGPGGNEQIKDTKVQIDGGLASLWTYYTFTPGGATKVDHCGVDAFLLRKGPDGWKIFHVADTSRSEGCASVGK